MTRRREPPTITRMVRRMEGCGLLERRRDPRDARSSRVHLTEAGLALEEPVARCWERAEQRTLADMIPDEQQTLRELLAKVRSNLA